MPAYTAVDRAETDRELAHKVNAEAPRAAESLASINRGSRLLQISTDFVFSGGQSYPTGLKIRQSIEQLRRKQGRRRAAVRSSSTPAPMGALRSCAQAGCTDRWAKISY